MTCFGFLQGAAQTSFERFTTLITGIVCGFHDFQSSHFQPSFLDLDFLFILAQKLAFKRKQKLRESGCQPPSYSGFQLDEVHARNPVS
jgi:hypothetical protein